MIKAYLVFGLILAFIFGSLLASTLHYKGEYEKCRVNSDNLKVLIDNQNTAIEKLKLDTENYSATIALQEQKLKTRYQSLKSDKDLASCEAKLSEILKALEIFENKDETLEKGLAL